jgi:pyruvate dehydrogenase E2 component (dihydrolipoamide acetyltransferase)
MVERVFNLPDLGEGLEEAEIGEWLVAEGDVVSLYQPIAEVETAKAVVEMPSPFSGRVTRLHAHAGDTVGVGEPLITFEVDEAPAGGAGEVEGPSSPSEVAATPAVRKRAKDLGVDIASVAGTGPEDRVTRQDVERAAGASPAAAGTDADVEVIPISVVRRTIAENLLRVVREVPSVTTFRTLDCTALEALRRALGVSPLPVVARALAEVCRAHPMLNASYLADVGQIHAHRAVHVSIATDTERGLMVPVVRNVGRLGIGEIGAEIARLAAAARDGALKPADMSGGTITVTNTGSYGSEAGTPILNPPQAAILALGAIQPRALVVDGQVVARPACTLSLTFDHRVLDGATAGRAFGDLVDLLEHSERLGALPR